MKSIGIVGAGIMATGMVQNFLRHDYKVMIWNRTKDHVNELLQAGAGWADSPQIVADASGIIIECVTDDAASREVWTDPQTGILAGAKPGKVCIASSSLSLDWTDELAGLCKAQNIDFLDMPLTGSRAGAEGGTLRLLVGGDSNVLDSIRQDLGAISEKIYYFGPAGSGMRFKLILNMLIAIHVDAAAQAAGLAERAGLDVRAVHQALFDGNMGPASPATNMLFNNLDMSVGQINFATKWLAKDLCYAQAMAKQYGVGVNLLDDAATDFAKAADSGYADQDFTKVAQLYRSDGKKQME